MTLRHGLFVMNGTAGVTQPQDARLALAGLLTGPGLLSGGAVTGDSAGPNMKYDLAAGSFATARGSATTDGLYLFDNDGSILVDSGTPAPSSGSRWDLIWVRHQNANDGFADANSDPVLGVTVGVAGSTPSKPYASVPAGALVLAEANVGTSIANASLAVISQVAAAAGARIPIAANSTQHPASPYVGQYVHDLTAGLMRWDGSVWRPAAGQLQTFTPAWTNLTVGNGSQVAEYQINGRIMTIRIWLVAGSTTAISGNVSLTLPAGFTAASDGQPQDLFARLGYGASGGTRATGFATIAAGGNSLLPLFPTSTTNGAMVQLGSVGLTFGPASMISIQGTLVLA